MSFYLRKSLKVGPLRMNLSRSGLGASVGVPGFRVGAGPRGSYISVGAAGVYYRSTAHTGQRHGTRSPVVPAPLPTGTPSGPGPGEVVLSDVTGATAIEMSVAEPSELVAQLNAAATTPRLWPWILVASLLLASVTPFLLLVGLPLTAWVFGKDRVRRTVAVFYEVRDQGSAATYQCLVDAFDQIRRTAGAWQIVAAGEVTSTYQHKVNAGATSVINRTSLARTVDGPRHMSTNIAVPTLSAAHRAVHFLPDRVLIRDGRRYVDITYGELNASAHEQRFIEDDVVPRDATVVGHTWKYVNVKGGPDRRFNNNRQLPIACYGRVTLIAPNGYRATLDFSRPDVAAAFTIAIRSMTSPPSAPAATPAPASARGAVASDPECPARSPMSARISVTPLEPSTVASLTELAPHGLTSGSRDARPLIDLDQPSTIRSEIRVSAPTNRPSTVDAETLRERRLSADGRVSVVGESHYQAALARAAAGFPAGDTFAAHIPVTALVIPEPNNSYDPNAVRVAIALDGTRRTVGYLSRFDAAVYQPHLQALAEQGQVGTCPARITGGGPGRSYGLYLHLAVANDLLLANLTTDAELLEPQHQVTVTREENHQDILAGYRPRRLGSVTRLVAELYPSTVTKGKYAGAYAIEVRLNGQRVGELTHAMSTRYQHLMCDGAAGGHSLRCEAVLAQGERGYQLELRMPAAA